MNGTPELSGHLRQLILAAMKWQKIEVTFKCCCCCCYCQGGRDVYLRWLALGILHLDLGVDIYWIIAMCSMCSP